MTSYEFSSMFILLIRLYQLVRPVLDSALYSVFGFKFHCKFDQMGQESCSEYTISQIKKHGTIAGLSLGVKRIGSCWSL